MKYYLPGSVKEIEDVLPGSCILFSMHQKAKIGFLVEIHDGERGILDIDAQTVDGEKYPAVYLLENFGRERIFVYDEARIVPSVETLSIGFGYHGNGRINKALYLVGDELVVQASRKQRHFRINLITGTLTQTEISSAIHCTQWHVEARNADGDYRPLIEFKA